MCACVCVCVSVRLRLCVKRRGWGRMLTVGGSLHANEELNTCVRVCDHLCFEDLRRCLNEKAQSVFAGRVVRACGGGLHWNSASMLGVGTCLRALLSVLFQVNENFAIDLIAEQPVSQVGSRVISCDGGGGALGHPRVYINLVTCCPDPGPSPCPVLSPLAAHAWLGPAHEPSTGAEQRAGMHRASRTG